MNTTIGHTAYTQHPARWCWLLLIVCCWSGAWAEDGAHMEYTPYGEQKAVYEFYYDHPAKLNAALYWLRTHLYTLGEEPYDIPPDFIDIKVVMHGTEVVTLAKKNYEKYADLVERMRYYAELGVDFRVCVRTLEEYGYKPKDMQDFVTIIPAAITDLVHWQSQGYALIIPRVYEKHFTVDELK
jgi:intracellular sulfur oxidation DsrE/DsrF family protein